MREHGFQMKRPDKNTKDNRPIIIIVNSVQGLLKLFAGSLQKKSTEQSLPILYLTRFITKTLVICDCLSLVSR